MPWEPTAVKAVQGHKDWVIERIGNRAICQEIYSLDDEFDVDKLDRGYHPRFNCDPETSHSYTTFPRVVYHSTDFRGCSDIIKNGLVVGGFPRKTGRGHNYFTVTPPWVANMRKLAGTRAGQPIYLAFDTELMLQEGVKLFRTDAAILSPDWISNKHLMFAYNARDASFAWANPAYPKFRSDYHSSLKEFQDADPNHPAAPAQYQLSRLGMMKNFMLVDNWADVKSKVVKGAVNIVRPPRELEGVIDELAQTDARRKAQPGTEAESCELRGYMLAPCAIVQNSDIAGLRSAHRNRNRPWARGQDSYDLEPKDVAINVILRIPVEKCRTPLCGNENWQGGIKCDYCKAHLTVWPDARIATEAARAQAEADLQNTTCVIEDLIKRIPRKARQTKSAAEAGDTERRGARSAFGVLRDNAKAHIRQAKKRGAATLRERLETDPFYAVNCARANLTPDALDFLQRLGRSMNPKLGRTAEQRKGKKGKGTGKDDQAAEEQEEMEARATRLCFILKLERGDDDPVNLADEAFVAHKCRFLTLAQFATYVDFAILQKNQPPPVIIGWNDKQCQPEGSAENILKDLVSFARLNWPDAANEFGHSLKVIEGTHKKVSAVSRKSTANQNLRSGFFPVDQAEHKAKKGKGKGKAPASGCFVCGGPHYKIDCPTYHEQRLQQRTQSRKGKGKGKSDRPRPSAPAAHQWRMVSKPSEGKGPAGSSSDAVVGPPERTIAQDIAMKGAAKAKGKGKSDSQPKGKGKYEPQKGQYKSEPYKGQGKEQGKEKGKEKGKGKPAQERVYYGEREWSGSWSFSWKWTASRGWYWEWDP